MIFLIYLFAAFLVIAGLTLTVKPGVVFQYLGRYSQNLGLYAVAIVVRIILGSLLIYTASFSRFPMVVLILGWITLIAGVVILLMGWNRFRRLMTWVLSQGRGFGPVGGVMSVGFGLFLIYAFI